MIDPDWLKRLLAAVAFGLAVAPALHAEAAAPVAAESTQHAVAPASPAERGRYLATAANCISCHTREGGAPFAGGVAFATPFGTMYSSNITSEPETGIGKWSRDDFARALREGVSPGGEHLYPAFPYTAFTKLSDADVDALYAYFKTVPAAKSAAPQNQMRFPYNQRWALGLWKVLYFSQGRFAPDSSKSAEWNRGAYLVQALEALRRVPLAAEFRGSGKHGQGHVGRWSTLTRCPAGSCVYGPLPTSRRPRRGCVPGRWMIWPPISRPAATASQKLSGP